MKIEIQDYTSTHQQAAADLINAGLGEHFGFVDSTQNPDLFDIASSFRDGHFLLALCGGKVVGTGALVTESDIVARVVRMHTDAKFRRHGVGTEVMRHLERRALDHGYKEIVLDTNVDWHDAIGFYRAKGYEELGRNEYGIRFHKVLRSTLSLGVAPHWRA